MTFPSARSPISTGADCWLPVLLPNLANLPRWPLHCSADFTSFPWLSNCLLNSHGTPFTANFQLCREKKDYSHKSTQPPAFSRRTRLLPCPWGSLSPSQPIHQEPRGHLSCLPHPPLTLSPSLHDHTNFIFHLFPTLPAAWPLPHHCSC